MTYPTVIADIGGYGSDICYRFHPLTLLFVSGLAVEISLYFFTNISKIHINTFQNFKIIAAYLSMKSLHFCANWYKNTIQSSLLLFQETHTKQNCYICHVLVELR